VGIGQPISGAIADRFGTCAWFSAGALMYAAGLIMMRYGIHALFARLSAGVLIGLGLSAASFNLCAVGRSENPSGANWRGLSRLGAGTRRGRSDIRVCAVRRRHVDNFGWQPP